MRASPGTLIGAQRERTQTPIRLFTPPADPRQLWPESTLQGVLLDRPLAAVPFGDWAILGHAHGLLVCQPRTLAWTIIPNQPVRSLWTAGKFAYALSDGSVTVWRK